MIVYKDKRFSDIEASKASLSKVSAGRKFGVSVRELIKHRNTPYEKCTYQFIIHYRYTPGRIIWKGKLHDSYKECLEEGFRQAFHFLWKNQLLEI